jgi:hypothetical protein
MVLIQNAYTRVLGEDRKLAFVAVDLSHVAAESDITEGFSTHRTGCLGEDGGTVQKLKAKRRFAQTGLSRKNEVAPSPVRSPLRGDSVKTFFLYSKKQ